MVSKIIKCPKCKTHITIQGNPGERISVKCNNCNTKGYFTLPDSTPQAEPIRDSSAISIDIRNLTKHFKGVNAVNGATFKVKKGEIFGFLGPNGAGKTTTIKAMLNLIHMDSGQVRINGLDIKNDDIQIKKNIGFLPERVSFYENLTPIQTLNFFCELKGVNKSIIPSLIKNVGLEDAKYRKVGTFSKGMVQLLGFAQVQIGNPTIYILDEPMSGLDARWVKIIREKIMDLNSRGATIMFSSHILSEVESLCNRVAIIKKGKIIAENTISNISKYLRIKPRLKITFKNFNGKIPEVLKNLEGVEDIEIRGDSLLLSCDSLIRSKIISLLEKAGYVISDFRTFEPSLEDAFVKLVDGDA